MTEEEGIIITLIKEQRKQTMHNAIAHHLMPSHTLNRVPPVPVQPGSAHDKWQGCISTPGAVIAGVLDAPPSKSKLGLALCCQRD